MDSKYEEFWEISYLCCCSGFCLNIVLSRLEMLLVYLYTALSLVFQGINKISRLITNIVGKRKYIHLATFSCRYWVPVIGCSTARAFINPSAVIALEAVINWKKIFTKKLPKLPEFSLTTYRYNGFVFCEFLWFILSLRPKSNVSFFIFIWYYQYLKKK